MSWSAVDQGTQEAFRFAAIVVLSRLLTPAEFGVVALLTVFTAFVGILADFNIANAVVQKPGLTPEFLDTAFWTNVALGVIAFALVWCSAPLLESVYADPRLIDLARVTACSFLISPLGGVPCGLLLRQIDFRRLALRNVAGSAASFGTTVFFAYRGFGAMSLALGTVANAAALALTSWSMAEWRPRWRFSRRDFRLLLPFSGRLALSSTIGHWSRNIDQFLIGSLVGEHALGLYSRAMALLLMPLRKIAGRVDAVMFPAFAAIQQDSAAIAEIYLRSTRLVALLTTPICFGAAAVAPELVRLVFGENWLGMIPLVWILAPLGALQSILTMGSAIYLAKGRTDLSLRVTVWSTLACSLCVFLGLRIGGVVGVAAGYAFFSVVTAPFIYLAGARLVGLGLRHQAANVGGIFVAAFVMAMAVAGLRLALGGWSTGLTLLLCVMAGAVAYVFLLHIAKVRAYVEFVSVSRKFFSEKKARFFRFNHSG